MTSDIFFSCSFSMWLMAKSTDHKSAEYQLSMDQRPELLLLHMADLFYNLSYRLQILPAVEADIQKLSGAQNHYSLCRALQQSQASLILVSLSLLLSRMTLVIPSGQVFKASLIYSQVQLSIMERKGKSNPKHRLLERRLE